LRTVTLLALLLAGCAPSPRPGAAPAVRWWRGNTHTHTLWSDGDGAPESVVAWYKEHGYDFLVLSDHNSVLTGERWATVGTKWGQLPRAHLDALLAQYGSRVVTREREGTVEMLLRPLDDVRREFEEKGRFLMVAGEEISDVIGPAKTPLHHNALNTPRLIQPPGGATVREAMERTVRLVEEEQQRCGCPVLVHLNHPNYAWAVTAEDLAHVVGERFFEVYNGHQLVHNEGDATRPGSERIWDLALTLRLTEIGGPLLYGLATDDAHEHHKFPAVANPGRGWIVVRAPALTAEALLAAMRAGDFYASSGVALEDVSHDAAGLSVRVAPKPGDTYTIRFLGTRKGAKEIGELLREVEGTSARYDFRGDELYVRATVISSRLHPNPYAAGDRETAWVQPVPVRGRE